MTEHLTEILIALIGATPPTLMAAAAWRKAAKLSKPLDAVNHAVNHRQGSQKRLIEVIDEMAESMGTISHSVRRVEEDIQSHRAWHQRQEEFDADPWQEEDN
jgi:hypothetical protein